MTQFVCVCVKEGGNRQTAPATVTAAATDAPGGGGQQQKQANPQVPGDPPLIHTCSWLAMSMTLGRAGKEGWLWYQPTTRMPYSSFITSVTCMFEKCDVDK
jgi:hypothetical protein